MSTIRRIDTIGTKTLLHMGEFGLDMYVAGDDTGRVYVGTGIENIPVARLDEIEVPVIEEAVVGQTTVSVADSANMLLRVDGAVQIEGTDYTITDATTIELTTPLVGTEIVSVLTITDVLDILASKYNIANGVLQLDSSGLIDTAQLPSYVDDVVEVATYADLPVIGEAGKIYVVVADEASGGDTSSYRWAGTVYAMVSNTLTSADIKALYEGNADTNVFDDAAQTKLTGTEITSQLNVRDTTNRNTDNHTDGVVNGVYTLAERSKLGAIDQGLATTDDVVFNTVGGRDVSVDGTKLDTIEVNAKDDQIASEVPVTPQGNLVSTDVQGALLELQGVLDNLTTEVEW